MKKVFLILLSLMLITGCQSTKGIPKQKLTPIQPAAYADLRGKTNVVVKRHVNVLTSTGETVNIPLVSTNPPESVIAKLTKKETKPETLFIVEVDDKLTAPTKETPKTNYVSTALPEPQPQKPTWWERNKKSLLSFYISVAVVSSGIWFGWSKFFKKKPAPKAKLVQTGDFKQPSQPTQPPQA